MHHFVKMLNALYAEKVEFLVVGRDALAASGSPRAIGDIVIWVNPTSQNALRVFKALQAFGVPLKSYFTQPSDFEDEALVYEVGLPPDQIDIVTSISSVSFQKAWERRQEITYLGHDLAVFSDNDFSINKIPDNQPKNMIKKADASYENKH